MAQQPGHPDAGSPAAWAKDRGGLGTIGRSTDRAAEAASATVWASAVGRGLELVRAHPRLAGRNPCTFRSPTRRGEKEPGMCHGRGQIQLLCTPQLVTTQGNAATPPYKPRARVVLSRHRQPAVSVFHPDL